MNSKFLSRIARHLLIPNRSFVLFVVLMSVFAMRASSGAPMATAPQSSATDELTGKLQVWQKDSTMVAFMLIDQPKVQFVGDVMQISARSVTMEYAYHDLWKLTYDVFDPTGIIDVIADRQDKLPYEMTDEAIVMRANTRPLQVRMCALNGTVICHQTIARGKDARIELNALQSGIYLLNVNGVTYRICVK